MAVLDCLSGVEVTIVADGQLLKQWTDADIPEEDRTVTRWIEARSDQFFKVQTNVEKGTKLKGDCLTVRIYMDGEYAGGVVIGKKNFAPGKYIAIVEGAHSGRTEFRNYRFSSLEQASDGRAFKDEASRVKHLGTIRVSVQDCCTGKDASKQNGHGYAKLKDDLGFLSEKCIKGQALSHSIGFGPPSKVDTPVTFAHSTNVDPHGRDAGTLVFRYCSLEVLKSSLIVPRTPSPPPLEDRDFDTLTNDEKRELARRAKVARDEKDAAVKVKRERQEETPVVRKKARPAAGNIQLEIDDDGSVRDASATLSAREAPIDLTDD